VWASIWAVRVAVTPDGRLGAFVRRGERTAATIRTPMEWAIALEGRTDLGGILLLLEDRAEAESIAGEMRERGHRVAVRPYPLRPAAPPHKARAR